MVPSTLQSSLEKSHNDLLQNWASSLSRVDCSCVGQRLSLLDLVHDGLRHHYSQLSRCFLPFFCFQWSRFSLSFDNFQSFLREYGKKPRETTNRKGEKGKSNDASCSDKTRTIMHCASTLRFVGAFVLVNHRESFEGDEVLTFFFSFGG